MTTLGSCAGSDTKRSDDRFAGEVGKHDMAGVGHDGMRNACFSTFTCSAFELSQIFALDGNLGSANAVLAAIGEGGFGILVKTGPQAIGIGVTCLGTEFAGSHLQIGADQCIDVELLLFEFFC